MSIELFLYLADILGNLDCYAGLIVLACLIAIAFIAFIYFLVFDYPDEREQFLKRIKKSLKYVSVILIISSLISIFVPGKKTMYAIGFTHYAKQTDIPRKLIDLLNQKLDDALNGEKL